MLTNKEISKQIENGNIQITNLLSGALDKPNSCMISLSDELYTFDYSIIDTKDSSLYMNEVLTGQINNLRKTLIPKN